MNRSLVLAALISAAALNPAWAVEVAPGSEKASHEIEDMARALAATARSAEASATPGDTRQVQRRVASQVEEVIVTAAKPPTNVRVALQRAVYICVRPDEVRNSGFACPETDAGMQGLRDVLATVTALIDGSETAAVQDLGAPPINPPLKPEFGASADYKHVR